MTSKTLQKAIRGPLLALALIGVLDRYGARDTRE